VSSPEITVVIPSLNRWDMLERTLWGVLRQEDVDVDVLVVDDGSSDETPRRLFEHPDPRVRTLRHARPLGVARARNDGLAAVRAPWTAFLDDDDLWAPRKLREQLDAAAAADAVMAYSASVVVDERLVPIARDPAPPAAELLSALIGHNAIPGGCSNVIARTEALVRLGGFDPALSMIADWDLWLRLAADGPAGACEQVHVAYVDHGASMHVEGAAVIPRELRYLRDKHAALVAGRKRELGSRSWFLLWGANSQRVAGHRWPAVRSYLRTAVTNGSPGALQRAVVGVFTDRLARRDVAEAAGPIAAAPEWLRAYTQAPAWNGATPMSDPSPGAARGCTSQARAR
jgi:glycosyltransferase involved in cell wall biosynthesis